MRVKSYRKIWELHNGPIPKGYVIHHKDLNHYNDAIDNLECMTLGEHTKLHMKLKPNVVSQSMLDAAAKWHKSEAGREWHRKQRLSIIERGLNKPVSQATRIAAVAWHKSEEGLAWHRMKNSTPRNKVCTQCSKEYMGVNRQKYCTPECKHIAHIQRTATKQLTQVG